MKKQSQLGLILAGCLACLPQVGRPEGVPRIVTDEVAQHLRGIVGEDLPKIPTNGGYRFWAETRFDHILVTVSGEQISPFYGTLNKSEGNTPVVCALFSISVDVSTRATTQDPFGKRSFFDLNATACRSLEDLNAYPPKSVSVGLTLKPPRTSNLPFPRTSGTPQEP